MREFSLATIFFGTSICVTALMPTLQTSILGMVFVGFFSIEVTSTGSTILQLSAQEYIRGRVMALWSMAIFGTTLFGAPLVGFIAEHFGARLGLGIGGIAALCAGAILSFELAPVVHRLKSQETI